MEIEKLLEVKSLAIQLSQYEPKVIGFTFPESPNWLKPQVSSDDRKPKPGLMSKEVSPEIKDSNQSPPTNKSITRIRPPRDLVRLEDRLYYLLQPPLESLVGSVKLSFPFPPFPYQYEGIAFLFPRDAAILADEMGLGKTMQAITTIRMLLLAGEIQSVLLICPKPLVTNWVREFRLWAPEVPVAVIEGDQTKEIGFGITHKPQSR